MDGVLISVAAVQPPIFHSRCNNASLKSLNEVEEICTGCVYLSLYWSARRWPGSYPLRLRRLRPIRPCPAHRRPTWAATAEESAAFDKLDNLVRYEDDGTGTQETIAVIRVHSQAGVQALGQLVFGYSSATEKLDVD